MLACGWKPFLVIHTVYIYMGGVGVGDVLSQPCSFSVFRLVMEVTSFKYLNTFMGETIRSYQKCRKINKFLHNN